jgi:hypothetical protein
VYEFHISLKRTILSDFENLEREIDRLTEREGQNGINEREN